MGNPDSTKAERSEDRSIRGTERGFTRLATAAAFASLFSYATVTSITEAAMRAIGRTYHKPESVLGCLYLMEGAGFFVAVLVGGRISDRRGKLPVMLGGCLAMSVGAYAFAWTSSFGMAAAAMLLIGVGGGLSEGIAMAALSDLYGERRRTAVLNWSQAAFALGAVAAPTAVARLLSLGIGWRVGYLAATAICAASGLLSLSAAAMKREKPVAAHGSDWRPLVSDPLVIWLSLGILLYVGATLGLASWLSTYFEKSLRSTAALAASTVALLWGGIGVGRAVAAWLSKHLSDVALVTWSLGLAAACQVAMLVVSSPVAAFAAVAAIGFCLGPVWPTILSRAGAAYPAQSGTVFSILVAMGAVGFVAFPPLLGVAGTALGMGRALWLCFLLLVVSLAIFVRLWGRESLHRRSASSSEALAPPAHRDPGGSA